MNLAKCSVSCQCPRLSNSFCSERTDILHHPMEEIYRCKFCSLFTVQTNGDGKFPQNVDENCCDNASQWRNQRENLFCPLCNCKIEMRTNGDDSFISAKRGPQLLRRRSLVVDPCRDRNAQGSNFSLIPKNHENCAQGFLPECSNHGVWFWKKIHLNSGLNFWKRVWTNWRQRWLPPDPNSQSIRSLVEILKKSGGDLIKISHVFSCFIPNLLWKNSTWYNFFELNGRYLYILHPFELYLPVSTPHSKNLEHCILEPVDRPKPKNPLPTPTALLHDTIVWFVKFLSSLPPPPQ